MLKKPTDNMLAELLQANSIKDYLKANEEQLANCAAAELLCAFIQKKGLSKAQVIKKSEINEIYAYQILAGKRQPSRDRLISLCVGAEMELDEIQSALKMLGYAPLYPKIKRDSVIILGISRGKTVCEINNELFENDEETL